MTTKRWTFWISAMLLLHSKMEFNCKTRRKTNFAWTCNFMNTLSDKWLELMRWKVRESSTLAAEEEVDSPSLSLSFIHRRQLELTLVAKASLFARTGFKRWGRAWAILKMVNVGKTIWKVSVIYSTTKVMLKIYQIILQSINVNTITFSASRALIAMMTFNLSLRV